MANTGFDVFEDTARNARKELCIPTLKLPFPTQKLYAFTESCPFDNPLYNRSGPQVINSDYTQLES